MTIYPNLIRISILLQANPINHVYHTWVWVNSISPPTLGSSNENSYWIPKCLILGTDNITACSSNVYPTLITENKNSLKPRTDFANSPTLAIEKSNPEKLHFSVIFRCFVSEIIYVSQYAKSNNSISGYKSQLFASSSTPLNENHKDKYTVDTLFRLLNCRDDIWKTHSILQHLYLPSISRHHANHMLLSTSNSTFINRLQHDLH